ncbi:MAG: hypothetical protein EOS20_01490 [Mesorhizobium sp.]|uniref:hypothetical protein n=1 Tax=Mesorhizobium sp. TaxID=1871066 RepID=UPI000FE92E01|nr:hypothetical protein [Mesorhizobium sp.]RWQ40748.1 MAG: hypothetical protein EOS20_01490 [Mesorhizobium sp.]
MQQIDIKLGGVEKHALSISLQAVLITVLVDDLPQLREAPSQRSPWIVRDLPEHLAQMVASLPPSKKTRALLAYLVATNRRQRRDHLCQMRLLTRWIGCFASG